MWDSLRSSPVSGRPSSTSSLAAINVKSYSPTIAYDEAKSLGRPNPVQQRGDTLSLLLQGPNDVFLIRGLHYLEADLAKVQGRLQASSTPGQIAFTEKALVEETP